jgi:predicted DsbA family dithiol-disulfide isomerase
VVSVSYYTDPACPWSWAAEPAVRKLMVQFGDSLAWTFVMGGLARELTDMLREPSSVGVAGAGDPERTRARLIQHWLAVADEADVPIDPLLWVEGPLSSTYPACMAMRAASEQADDGGQRYLRRLREGILCERRKLDHAEALVEEARAVGLDVERFRIDLLSHAITEAFGRDLEETKGLSGRDDLVWVPDRGPDFPAKSSPGAGDTPLPTLAFSGEGGRALAVAGYTPYESYRAAAVGAGARERDARPPTVEELVARFGRVTTREVEEICELPGPRAGAELYRLAEQWKLRPLRRASGYLWERA